MLELLDVRGGYDGEEVLHGLSFSVEPGSVVAVIGSNGAGKTTTLKVISGLLRCRHGKVVVDGRRLSGGSTEEAVKAGVAHVPEGRQVFANMTVRENLLLGGYAARSADSARRLDTVLGVFPELSSRLRDYAGSLSGGQQQMLAISRGLMSDPRYLLLDEPSLGLAPLVTKRIFEVIERLRADGRGILMVEQNGALALGLAQQAFLLEKGAITLTGSGQELLANHEVVERYLGVGRFTGATGSQERWTNALAAAFDDDRDAVSASATAETTGMEGTWTSPGS
ncbi:MAG: ABC transporter ATP-binding protein [Acidimicrobiales bacterium]